MPRQLFVDDRIRYFHDQIPSRFERLLPTLELLYRIIYAFFDPNILELFYLAICVVGVSIIFLFLLQDALNLYNRSLQLSD